MLSSPSGGGKSTIAKHLLAARDDVTYSVSATTRERRGHERDGEDYHFLTLPEFERRIAAGDFLEWATYGGHRYGTLLAEVEKGLAKGSHVVLDIEVQGAEQLRQSYPDAVRVFVLPPSASELSARLRSRGTENESQLGRRLEIAGSELTLATQYDYVVVNDDLVDAVSQVAAILDVESRRANRIANLATVVAMIRHELSNNGPAAPR